MRTVCRAAEWTGPHEPILIVRGGSLTEIRRKYRQMQRLCPRLVALLLLSTTFGTESRRRQSRWRLGRGGQPDIDRRRAFLPLSSAPGSRWRRSSPPRGRQTPSGWGRPTRLSPRRSCETAAPADACTDRPIAPASRGIGVKFASRRGFWSRAVDNWTRRGQPKGSDTGGSLDTGRGRSSE